MTDYTPELTQFFKALADDERLQIAGLLARKSLTGSQLAEATGLKPAAFSKHIRYLIQAELVSAAAGKYKLRLDHIHALAAKVSARAAPPVPEDADEFARNVWTAFLTPEGTLKEIPMQEKKVLVILRHLLNQFEAGREYAEKEVNEIIKRLHPDSATLRRMLVDFGMMKRERGVYWRMADSE